MLTRVIESILKHAIKPATGIGSKCSRVVNNPKIYVNELVLSLQAKALREYLKKMSVSIMPHRECRDLGGNCERVQNITGCHQRAEYFFWQFLYTCTISGNVMLSKSTQKNK